MHRQRLVLFDIDGTLLWSDGAGKAAMRAALKSVYGTAGPIDSFSFAGRTDRQAVRYLLTVAGIDEASIWAGFDQLSESLTAELKTRVDRQAHHIRACPGGQALIETLHARDDVLLGLLTGNMRTTAEIKLTTAGYSTDDFPIGAFGDEAELRGISGAAEKLSGEVVGRFPGASPVPRRAMRGPVLWRRLTRFRSRSRARHFHDW